MKFTGHLLRHSTTPNVPTLYTQSSQAINLALIVFAATLSGHRLCPNTDHRRTFTPIY